MKLSSLLFVGLVLFQISCSDDPPPPEVDALVGKWAMSGAIFNSTNVEPNAIMSIENFGVAGNTLQVPAGSPILEIVVGSMADNVCEEVTSYGTFFIELTAEGRLFLNCPDEEVSEDTGTWVRIEDPVAGTTITLSVVTDAGTLPIVFSNVAMLGDGSKFTGVTAGYPMVQDLALPLAAGTNLQLLNSNMEFTRLP